MSQKTILMTNVYNEEYLLPFWLHHHKDMFDEIVIVDYRSTDRSLEYCKSICPNCVIQTTLNEKFEAEKIDQEFMYLVECKYEGIKIILNTTEFLFCHKPIKQIFEEINCKAALQIQVYSPHSLDDFDPINSYELFNSLVNNKYDIKFSTYRGSRYIHNMINGFYGPGRHESYHHNKIVTNDLKIICLSYYPLNEKFLRRKLQIQNNIPPSEIVKGFGLYHITTREKIYCESIQHYNVSKKLNQLDENFNNLLCNLYTNKTFVVTGGCGFIGSHLVDRLIHYNNKVIVIDNCSTGSYENCNKSAVFIKEDITNISKLEEIFNKFNSIDGVFHLAAIARTPWCIDDPVLCYNVNVLGTINVLEVCRKKNIKRVVLSSSNVVYAAYTPYRTSKEALENIGKAYNDLYNMSIVSLRYSNVYGKRQSEEGPSPNVFASLRKSKRELGKLLITGDGTQTRNYTHVSDIVEGNVLAMFSKVTGVIDLCTGISIPLNEAAEYFECPIEYIDERKGDIKHIIQCPKEAFNKLGWTAKVKLEDGIKDVINI